MRVVILLSLAVIAASQPNYQLEEEWRVWKILHEKNYQSDLEELERHLIWLSNVEYVNRHNEHAEFFGFTLAMNHFGDMEDTEFARQYLTYKPKKRLSMDTSHNEQVTQDNDDPTYVDWRTRNAVTPIKNQGQCGASYAFSAIAAIEGAQSLAHGKLRNLSEQNIIDCSVSYGNQGCQAGSVEGAFKYVISSGGVDTEKSYPYVARQSSCAFSKKGIGAKISGIISLKSGSETALKTAVANVGPVSVSVDGSDRAFTFYANGIYTSSVCSSYTVNHAMVVTGYGTYNRPYWLVKNSWGTNWGMEGYILMSRNMYNQCGIATDASYPTL